MKTFIKPFAVAVVLLFADASFAQTAHPVRHRPVKHYKHYKKVSPARRSLPLLPAPPVKLPAAPPPPKLPPLPHH